MGLDRYLEAASRIPRGKTRSFREVAALAGRPGAARAAGRALAACPAGSSLPWQRVVAADGSLAADPARARLQLARLRREGARPGPREAVDAWARRVGAAFVGHLRRRVYLPPDDPALARGPAERLEPLADAAEARTRGLRVPGEAAATTAPSAGRRARAAAVAKPLAATWRRGLSALDGDAARRALAADGFWHVRRLLPAVACRALAAADHAFERQVDMVARGFGVGHYGYFPEPPPEPLASLREMLYERLRPAAGVLAGAATDFPPTLTGFHRRCRRAGQRRGSCILLRYPTGGLNHPHQDLYGSVAFPFQALLLLSRRGRDFTGGELLLVESWPDGRQTTRAVAVDEGDLVVFPSTQRLAPVEGRSHRLAVRHGMSLVRSGQRVAAGIVFHLAR